MITEVNVKAEHLGRATAHFEPGTSFYKEVVLPIWRDVERAETRDDLEKVMDKLTLTMTPHLTDDELRDLERTIEELRAIEGPWPVEAFKESFQIGSGLNMPEDRDVEAPDRK